VDQVDLLQLHNLANPQEWELALGPGGALEAAVEARDQGLVRFIGITGHGWNIARLHRLALERFDFDSVLLPFSYTMAQNAAYLADFNAVWELCRSRNTAVQTIKSIVRVPWGDRPQTRATWYEPLEDQPDIDLAVHWVLGHQGLFLNTVGDIHVLPKVLNAIQRFKVQPTEEQMQALAPGGRWSRCSLIDP
jgi:predicted aldo/keto reductase-like oxidoreductase